MRLGRAFLFLVVLSVPCLGSCQAQYRWPDVNLDQRDYSGNVQATDRNYAALSSVHPSVEYPASPTVTHVAYVRGNNVTVACRFRNWNTFALTGTLTLQAARLEVPKPHHEIGVDYITLGISPTTTSISLAADGGTQVVNVTLSSVPNYVAVGAIQIKFDLPLTDGEFWGNNGTNGAYDTWERLCVLDASPTGIQDVPWVDFLEYACRWGFGAAGSSALRHDFRLSL